jgi:hypothetical protein
LRQLFLISLLLSSGLVFAVPRQGGKPSSFLPPPRAAVTVPLAIDQTFTAADGRTYRFQGTLNLTVTDAPPPPLSAFTFVGANPVTSPGGTTVRVTLSSPAAIPVPVTVTASSPLARVDPLVVAQGLTQGTASIFVSGAEAGSRTLVTLTATLGSTSRTLVLTVLGPPPGPTIRGYTDPDGLPLAAAGTWVGSAVLIHGQQFGNEVIGGDPPDRWGEVTWNGIWFTHLAWSDQQVEAVLPDAVLASGSYPVVLHLPDGKTITGPPLSILTPLSGAAVVPPGSRLRQGR